MGAILVPIIVVVVVAIVALWGMRAWVSGHQRQADELAAPGTSSLDYLVPPGQDPVVVLTALSAEGYDASTDPDAPNLVHVACPAGPDRDRARVRAVIHAAGSTAVDAGVPFEPGEVRFTDER